MDSAPATEQPIREVTFSDSELWPDSNKTGGTRLFQGAVELEVIHGFVAKTPRLPAPTGWGTAAAFEEGVFLFGGALTTGDTQAGAKSDQILHYDPRSDQLQPMGTIPLGLSMSAAVSYPQDSAIFLIKGYDKDHKFEGQIQRYSPADQSITTVVENIITANRHAAARSGDQILIFGGYGTGPVRHEVEAFQPFSNDTPVVELPANLAKLGGRTFLTACPMPDGKIFLFGGDLEKTGDPAQVGTLLSEVLLFDPDAEKIKKVASLPRALKSAAVGLLPDGKIYILGGDNESPTTPVRSDAVFRFDPETYKMELLTETLPYPLSGAAHAVAYNGKLYLLGGRTVTGLSDQILEYRPFADMGVVVGQVIDSGAPMTKWRQLEWMATLPAGTSLTFDVRAANDPIQPDDPSPQWQPVTGINPVKSGLPVGRYFQWKAELRTNNSGLTPRLEQVVVSY